MSSVQILDEITPAQRKALAGGKSPEIIKKSQNPGATWNFAGLQRALDEVYKTVKLGLAGESGVKNAVLVFGDQGSGKSEVVRTFAQNVAKDYPDRKYLHFHNLKNVDQMAELIQDPSKYFVFLDLRAAQLAEHQVGGLPNPPESQKRGFVVWDPADWTALVTNPKFAGYMFLDEMNRAPEGTLNSFLGLILDRQISGRRLSDNCFVAAAANLGSKFVGITQLDPALFARFNIGTLQPDADSWARWAQKSGVDQEIIDFVLLDPAKNFIRNPAGEKQSVNPRNLYFASQNLKYMHYIYDKAIADAARDGITEPTAEQLVPYLNKYTVTGTDIPAMTGNVYEDYARIIVQRTGEEWTNDFMQFLRTRDEFEWEDVIGKLEKGEWKQKGGTKSAKDLSANKLFYLTRYIADTIVSRFVNAYRQLDQATAQRLTSWDGKDVTKHPLLQPDSKKVFEQFFQIGQWLGTAVNGLTEEDVAFVLERVFGADSPNGVIKGIEQATGIDFQQTPGGLSIMGNIIAGLAIPATAYLKSKGYKDAIEKWDKWAKLNKAGKLIGGFKEGMSAKAMYQERVAFNSKVSYKPKFKNFFKTS